MCDHSFCQYGSMCRPYGGMYGRGVGGWGMGMSGYGLYMKSYKKRGESTGDDGDKGVVCI